MSTVLQYVKQPTAMLHAVKDHVLEVVLHKGSPVSADQEAAVAAAYDEELGHNLTRAQRSKRAHQFADGGHPLVYKVSSSPKA